jgi:uncharacterized membrane protein YeaQ/YmgE (transglycosylase-associated protein family)
MGELLVFLLVGLVVGIIARALMPGRDPIGILGTILVGCTGAVIGGYLFGAVLPETDGVDWIGSIVMAVVLLWAYRKMAMGRSSSAL